MVLKSPTQKIDLNLLGVTLSLKSEVEGFVNFIHSFIGMLVNKNENFFHDIAVYLRSKKEFPIDSNYKQISRNLWLGDNSVILSGVDRVPGLSLKVSIDENRLYIDAFLEEKKINSFLRLMTIRRADKKKRLLKFILLIYYLIYIPCFYYLERFRNLSLLSAGAVKYKRNGVIFSGLGGIGKTTFSLGALFLDGSKLLSDNLIFHDTQKIFSLPGPIALDPNSLNTLKKIQKTLTPIINIPTHHNRMYYKIKSTLFVDNAVPKYIFWLQSGNRNTLKPLEKTTFAKHLLSINLLTNHIREYFVFAAAADLASPKNLSPHEYFEKTSALLANLDCFVLTFKPASDINAIFDNTINQVII
jgi:hypothetical protein